MDTDRYVSRRNFLAALPCTSNNSADHDRRASRERCIDSGRASPVGGSACRNGGGCGDAVAGRVGYVAAERCRAWVGDSMGRKEADTASGTLRPCRRPEPGLCLAAPDFSSVSQEAGGVGSCRVARRWPGAQCGRSLAPVLDRGRDTAVTDRTRRRGRSGSGWPTQQERSPRCASTTRGDAPGRTARRITKPSAYVVRGREWKPRPSSCAPIHAASSDLLSGT
jgi:hypothetical protein